MSLLLLASAAAAAMPCPPDTDAADPAALRFDLVQHAAERGWAVSTNAHGFHEVEVPLGPTNLTLIAVPAGDFLMGSPKGRGASNERPQHTVTLSEYRITKNLVTRAHFAAFEQATGYVSDMASGLKGDCQGCWVYPSSAWVRYKAKLKPGQVPCDEGIGCCHCDAFGMEPGARWNQTSSNFSTRGDLPVSCVSWNDAGAFGEWAAGELGLPHLVLPSEAQWMKAALGTSNDGREYPWGSELPDGTQCNFADASFMRQYGKARPCNDTVDDGWAGMSPVGSYPLGASPYGVLDMAGNGGEWAFDWFGSNYYSASEACNPLGPQPTSGKAPRGVDGKLSLGGAWNSNEGYKKGKWVGGCTGCKSSVRARNRQGSQPDSADDHTAFRLVFDPQRPADAIGVRSTLC